MGLRIALLICSCIYLIDGARFRCDYEYISEGSGWYKLHIEEITLSDAERICRYEGAEVGRPYTEEMEKKMLTWARNNPEITGLHIPFIRLDSRASVNQRGHLVLTSNGHYISAANNDSYSFVCFKYAGPSVQLNECGTLDNGYFLDARTGNCYKYHNNFSTWKQGKAICEFEEGRLVVINSVTEAEVIKDIFKKNPTSAYPQRHAWKDGAFIGSRATLSRDWVTIDGLTLKKGGYDLFATGEPNNARGDEDCLSVGRDGKLVDDPCTRTLPFICEKKPDSGCDLQNTHYNTINIIGKENYVIPENKDMYDVIMPGDNKIQI